ncbi:unnamed protein product [Amoebophrya sp. A120]|nr:unnamed protein product [Amoebophrya sp. A120]|eukprot:GSA120T00017957001.1
MERGGKKISRALVSVVALSTACGVLVPGFHVAPPKENAARAALVSGKILSNGSGVSVFTPFVRKREQRQRNQSNTASKRDESLPVNERGPFGVHGQARPKSNRAARGRSNAGGSGHRKQESDKVLKVQLDRERQPFEPISTTGRAEVLVEEPARPAPRLAPGSVTPALREDTPAPSPPADGFSTDVAAALLQKHELYEVEEANNEAREGEDKRKRRGQRVVAAAGLSDATTKLRRGAGATSSLPKELSLYEDCPIHVNVHSTAAAIDTIGLYDRASGLRTYYECLTYCAELVECTGLRFVSDSGDMFDSCRLFRGEDFEEQLQAKPNSDSTIMTGSCRRTVLSIVDEYRRSLRSGFGALQGKWSSNDPTPFSWDESPGNHNRNADAWGMYGTCSGQSMEAYMPKRTLPSGCWGQLVDPSEQTATAGSTYFSKDDDFANPGYFPGNVFLRRMPNELFGLGGHAAGSDPTQNCIKDRCEQCFASTGSAGTNWWQTDFQARHVAGFVVFRRDVQSSIDVNINEANYTLQNGGTEVAQATLPSVVDLYGTWVNVDATISAIKIESSNKAQGGYHHLVFCGFWLFEKATGAPVVGHYVHPYQDGSPELTATGDTRDTSAEPGLKIYYYPAQVLARRFPNELVDINPAEDACTTSPPGCDERLHMKYLRTDPPDHVSSLDLAFYDASLKREGAGERDWSWEYGDSCFWTKVDAYITHYWQVEFAERRVAGFLIYRRDIDRGGEWDDRIQGADVHLKRGAGSYSSSPDMSLPGFLSPYGTWVHIDERISGIQIKQSGPKGWGFCGFQLFESEEYLPSLGVGDGSTFSGHPQDCADRCRTTVGCTSFSVYKGKIEDSNSGSVATEDRVYAYRDYSMASLMKPPVLGGGVAAGKMEHACCMLWSNRRPRNTRTENSLDKTRVPRNLRGRSRAEWQFFGLIPPPATAHIYSATADTSLAEADLGAKIVNTQIASQIGANEKTWVYADHSGYGWFFGRSGQNKHIRGQQGTLSGCWQPLYRKHDGSSYPDAIWCPDNPAGGEERTCSDGPGDGTCDDDLSQSEAVFYFMALGEAKCLQIHDPQQGCPNPSDLFKFSARVRGTPPTNIDLARSLDGSGIPADQYPTSVNAANGDLIWLRMDEGPWYKIRSEAFTKNGATSETNLYANGYPVDSNNDEQEFDARDASSFCLGGGVSCGVGSVHKITVVPGKDGAVLHLLEIETALLDPFKGEGSWSTDNIKYGGNVAFLSSGATPKCADGPKSCGPRMKECSTMCGGAGDCDGCDAADGSAKGACCYANRATDPPECKQIPFSHFGMNTPGEIRRQNNMNPPRDPGVYYDYHQCVLYTPEKMPGRETKDLIKDDSRLGPRQMECAHVCDITKGGGWCSACDSKDGTSFGACCQKDTSTSRECASVAANEFFGVTDYHVCVIPVQVLPDNAEEKQTTGDESLLLQLQPLARAATGHGPVARSREKAHDTGSSSTTKRVDPFHLEDMPAEAGQQDPDDRGARTPVWDREASSLLQKRKLGRAGTTNIYAPEEITGRFLDPVANKFNATASSTYPTTFTWANWLPESVFNHKFPNRHLFLDDLRGGTFKKSECKKENLCEECFFSKYEENTLHWWKIKLDQPRNVTGFVIFKRDIEDNISEDGVEGADVYLNENSQTQPDIVLPTSLSIFGTWIAVDQEISSIRIEKKGYALGFCGFWLFENDPNAVPVIATPDFGAPVCDGCGPRQRDCSSHCEPGFCTSCDGLASEAHHHKGACCMKNYAEDPVECHHVALEEFTAMGYHECVLVEKAYENLGDGLCVAASGGYRPWAVTTFYLESEEIELSNAPTWQQCGALCDEFADCLGFEKYYVTAQGPTCKLLGVHIDETKGPTVIGPEDTRPDREYILVHPYNLINYHVISRHIPQDKEGGAPQDVPMIQVHSAYDGGIEGMECWRKNKDKSDTPAPSPAPSP